MQADRERKSLLVSGMRDHHLQALVCSSSTDVLILTGYWPVMSASLAVFTADGESHVLVPEDEQELAQHTTGAHIIPYEPEKLEELTDPITQLRQPLGELLNKLQLQRATIGIRRHITVQPASYAVATDFHESLAHLLQELLPTATFHAADAMLEQQRAVKTQHELTLIERTAKVAATGFAAAAAAIQPGLRETEVAASIQSAFETAPGAAAFQRSYGYFFCMSGPNSATAAAAYARTRQRRIEAGDLVMIHANTCGDGYWTDITRTYIVGQPTERQEKMRTAIMEARVAALVAIQPGAKASEVDQAARNVMKAHGLGKQFKHAAGHGVGFAAANANALPRIHPNSPDILSIGSTFNIEPAAYFQGYGGMRHCDVIAVTDKGAKVLTDFEDRP